MKRIILLFIILLTIIIAYSNDQINNINNQAIEAYQNKDFLKALELFLQIENENIINADLYYNIGNCYFRQNEIGKAILYYKRCLKINPGHEQAQKNLKFNLSLTKDKQEIENQDFISSIWNNILTNLNLNTLSIILLVIFIIIILMINIMIMIYRHREKTVPIFITSVLCVIFILFAIISVVQWQLLQNDRIAVLLTSTSAGFSGPSEEFTRVFTIHEGMIFEIEKLEGEWSLIKLNNGIGGWIRSDSFERI